MLIPVGFMAQNDSLNQTQPIQQETGHEGHNHAPGEHVDHDHAAENQNAPIHFSHGQSLQMAKPDSIATLINFNPEHIKKLEHLQVQDDQGRIKPLGTHALELLRKIYKKDDFHGVNSMEWFISLQQNPSLWANAPMIRVLEEKIGKKEAERLGVVDGYTSLMNLVDHQTTQFKLQDEYNRAFRKRPADKTEYDKEIMNITERFSIIDNISKGYYLRLIPEQNEINESWTSWLKPTEEMALDTVALKYISNYFNSLGLAQKTGNWSQANQSVQEISDYQQKWGQNVKLSDTKVSVEILFNHSRLFLWLMISYATIGGLLLIFAFIKLLSDKNAVQWIINILLGLLIVAFILHAAGLATFWYISGHAPWTDGYEAIIFISWVSVLAGLLMYRNGNAFLPTAGAFVAVIMMGFAHGSSLLDPQITPLVPVLKSYWLIVHVAIITSSYAFFGLGMMLAIFCLILFMLKPSKKIERTLKEITIVNEMSLTVGIFMLTIGTFLGGMWANESWGRYWSWDPKETWAFISIMMYAIVLHMRLVPGLRGKFALNIAALWAVSGPIMTYFGVNYYLSGLHTYAAGDSVPIPAWVPGTVVVFFILSIVAYILRRKYSKQNDFVSM